MCGIAGLSLAGPADAGWEASLERMVEALRHRGPDDQGSAAVPSGDAAEALLGNTRLAILDLSSAGHQPMRDPANGNWLVLNGEIYNHLEVRAALGAGERWRSRSDTETVLRAYARWGPECLHRLRGMFAIALWDAADRALWCARDRLGIKPFYYRAGGGQVVFASEVRALLASGRVPARVDAAGLAGFVRFGSVPEPLSLIDGVRSLPAGHWTRIRRGEMETPRPFWKPAAGSDLAAAAVPRAAVRELLEAAVGEHLVADVPVASFLSGGLDSSVVTALAARASAGRIRTFTVGLREADLDESGRAAAIAARCGTEHERVGLEDEEAAILAREAVGAMDQPSADGVNTFVVSRAVARRGVKVVLSGLGGDELFGGYRSFRLLPALERWSSLASWVPGRLWGLLGPASAGRAAQLFARGLTPRARYETLRAFWSDGELAALGFHVLPGYASDEPPSAAAWATRVSLLELSGYMRSTLLRDGDGMSMAHGLELRLPLLDHRLVEACLATDAAAAGAEPKALLRRAARELLPGDSWTARKQGFVLPMDRWMRSSLRAFVQEGAEKLCAQGVLPRCPIRELQSRFEARRLPWARLWQLVVLGHWADAHLGR